MSTWFVTAGLDNHGKFSKTWHWLKKKYVIIVHAFLAASFVIEGSDQWYKIPVIFYQLEKLKSIL